MRLTLRQIHIFTAIAQHGSTTSASLALSLSQSATSAALQELEATLGARLFDRVGKRLVLNENGRMLLPQAIRLLEAAAQVQDCFHKAGSITRLKVGCSTTIGNYIMPLLMDLLSQSAPGVQVDLSISNSADIARQAAQLSIDIGLIEGPCHLPELTARQWFEDELVIVAAASDPLAQRRHVPREALRSAPWLVRESGSGTAEEVFQRLLPHLGQWTNTRQIGSSEAIKRMVAAGIGISCLSRWVVNDLLENGRLVILDHDLPPQRRPLYAVHHSDKFLSRGLSEFQKVIADFAMTGAND